MNRKQILDDAAAAVLKDRSSIHGEPENSFPIIARYWSNLFGIEIQPWQVPVALALLKVARLQGNPTYPDNFVDLAGYAACGGELAMPDKLTADKMDASRISANPLGRHPNVIVSHFHDVEFNNEKRRIAVQDYEDVMKNGEIVFVLQIDNPCGIVEASNKATELLQSKSVIMNA